MDTENEQLIDDVLDDEPLEEVEETDDTDWKAEAQKLREKAIASRERTKALKAQVKELTPAKVEPKVKTDELDEAQLDYLDLKGITDQAEIDIIQKIVAKTGMTVRQALQDDYVTSKLDALRAEKEVKGAIPSSTKRGGGQVDTLTVAIAKFEKDGSLPDDFKLRSDVVNAIADKNNGNKPSWH